MKKTRRHLAAWIACCAMLFAALAPSLSLAMSRADTPMTEICSASGMKMVTGAGDPATHHAGHTQHCPLCGTHAWSAGAPPTAGFMLVLLATQESHPRLFFQAPHPLPAWIVAQSRAPPAFL